MSSGWPTANVCSTAKRGSLDRKIACLLPVICRFGLSALKAEREREGWGGGFDVEKLRHAELSDPLFFSITPPNPFSSFQNNLFLLSFDIKKKRTIIRAHPPFFFWFNTSGLLLQASKAPLLCPFMLFFFHCEFMPNKKGDDMIGAQMSGENISRKQRKKRNRERITSEVICSPS